MRLPLIWLLSVYSAVAVYAAAAADELEEDDDRHHEEEDGQRTGLMLDEKPVAEPDGREQHDEEEQEKRNVHARILSHR